MSSEPKEATVLIAFTDSVKRLVDYLYALSVLSSNTAQGSAYSSSFIIDYMPEI